MAQGDIKWFTQATLDVGLEIHQLETDTLKVALLKSAANGGIDLTISTGDPRWGAGGTTNLTTSEVTAGGNYTTGGVTLGGSAGAQTWTLVSNVATLRAADITITSNASNPTNARWAVIYNDTTAGKQAIGFIDLGSDRNLTTGDFTINFGGAGTDILTLTQS